MIRAFHIGATLAGLALSVVGLTAMASPTNTIAPPPLFPTNPCIHVVGTADPCTEPTMPPEPPEPVDPGCLRTDITPLRCPYQP